MNLTKEEKQRRVMIVLYRLAHGTPGIQVNKQKLLDEVNRLKVMEMTPEEFDQFHTDSVKQFKKVTVN